MRGLATSTNAERSDNSRANRSLPKHVATWAWTSFQMGVHEGEAVATPIRQPHRSRAPVPPLSIRMSPRGSRRLRFRVKSVRSVTATSAR